jgi:hypothetical protein
MDRLMKLREFLISWAILLENCPIYLKVFGLSQLLLEFPFLSQFPDHIVKALGQFTYFIFSVGLEFMVEISPATIRAALTTSSIGLV